LFFLDDDFEESSSDPEVGATMRGVGGVEEMIALRAARAKTQPHGRRATKGREPFISLRERGQMKREGREEVSVLAEEDSEEEEA